MRNILFYVLTVLGGYLLGCSSMAYYVSRWKKVNLSTNGSGNLGASNTTILLGWRMGILVALHDIFKGAAAVLLAKWLLPDLTYAPVAAGCACVMGHMYPFYLKGKGGKGFASYTGMLLALDWRLGLALIGVSLLVGAIIGLIALLIARRGMNTVKSKGSATDYVRQNTFRITGRQDIFLYSNVTKTRRDTDSGSSEGHSGGGSSVHTSSSGHSHGGGGGHF